MNIYYKSIPIFTTRNNHKCWREIGKKDMNIFNHSIENLKEIFSHFEDEKRKSKWKYKIYKVS